MVLPEVHTNPEEFTKFNSILESCGLHPYYFALEKEDKEPLKGRSWKSARLTYKEALSKLRRGYNIGVVASGHDMLIIVDVDDLKQVPEIKLTLQVTSRKRIGRHNYFIARDGTAKTNIATKDAGEVRGLWQYVLAPGSYVPCSEEEINRIPTEDRHNAGRYTLNNHIQVQDITFDELPEVYRRRYKEIQRDEIDNVIKRIGRVKNRTYKNGNKSALWDLDITDVSGVSDTKGRYIPMPSEIHGSETGHNCKVSNGLMHCWRHGCCHNAFSYLCMLAGIASCERAGRQHGGRFFGVDAQDGETVFKVWLYAKERGIIPENDPIPRSALVYYAVSRGCCKKGDIIDGWKLPEVGKVLAIIKAKQEGVNLGRN